jgi:uncharacterized damage-inducible protein DinB
MTHRSPLSLSLFPLALLFVVPAISADAQDVLDKKAASHLRVEYMSDLDTVHAKIRALAEAIPEDKYSWRPAPGVRSVSEVLMHVAGEWYFWVPRSIGKDAPADFGPSDAKLANLEKVAKKTDVLSELDKSWAHAKAQVNAADPATLTGRYKPWNFYLAQAMLAMAGDLHEHLGQLVGYARVNGVKPPWSKM